MMSIRKLREEDLPPIQTLFIDTIQHINSKDYSAAQIEVWSESGTYTERWKNKLVDHPYAIVAFLDDFIVGFASLEQDYLDLLYVHKDFQLKGIAKNLLQNIIQEAIKKNISVLFTEASITARPFFHHQGFEWIRQNKREIKGVELINYTMKKGLT